MPSLIEQAEQFIGGLQITFKEADALWKGLKSKGELSLAREVLERIRVDGALLDGLPKSRKGKNRLCQQEALLISKDTEVSTAVRHTLALEILSKEFDLDDPDLDGDSETLGIAGGILKRRWQDLGQFQDLMKAAEYYSRGAGDDMGDDAYCHINAAFLEDLIAGTGNEPDKRRDRARVLREQIIEALPVIKDSWFNAATRAEAYLGLGEYDKAIQALNTEAKPDPWELETTARQLASLTHLQEDNPFENPKVNRLLETLLGDAADAIHSALIGKVGLALSGGGFRAAFYHLGVLARLAELDVLRNIEVLSCVSGGSIIGTCYWLELRKRLENSDANGKVDYIDLIHSLIEHFETAVATDLRNQGQYQILRSIWKIAKGQQGVLDPVQAANALEENFYRPLLPGDGPIYMHDLAFTPADHKTEQTGSKKFNPIKHNWLRRHKVPALVLNATTINTGHAWQFTPTWMGESPWAIHEAADSVPRLQWSWYKPEAGWQITLGRAVAASAAVPGVFAPICIKNAYEGFEIQLVDGGVYDNQGTATLLAQSCNVILVSDAAGQLKLQQQPKEGLGGLISYAKRSMETLMERIRQANFGDLSIRLKSGLLQGMMFLHMKSGLDADTIRLPFDNKSYKITRSPLSPYGIRKEFQAALADLRTDLDAFNLDESRSLMACGYQMTKNAFEHGLGDMHGLYKTPKKTSWLFEAELAEITSTAANTRDRDRLLEVLIKGSQITT